MGACCWLVAPFSSEYWGFYSSAPLKLQTVRTGIFSVDILYFPQWNVSDGGISYQSSAEETALLYRALSETKFRRSCFLAPIPLQKRHPTVLWP